MFGGLGEPCTVHLKLIGKRIVDFLFVLIELLFVRCYGRDVTNEYRLQIGDFEGGDQFRPIFQLVWDVPREPFLHG